MNHCGNCPSCGNPIFYSVTGKTRDQDKPDMEIFRTCECPPINKPVHVPYPSKPEHDEEEGGCRG